MTMSPDDLVSVEPGLVIRRGDCTHEQASNNIKATALEHEAGILRNSGGRPRYVTFSRPNQSWCSVCGTLLVGADLY
jgi:hypothetical protein